MSSTKPNRKIPIHRVAARGVFHGVIPHAGNDYHPHLIRPVGLLAVFVFVLGLNLFSGAQRVGSVEATTPSQNDFSRQQMLNASNEEREKNGIPALKLNEDLSAAANLKARDMLVRRYWAHTAPDGTSPWYWFREVNYRYDYAGENLAKGFRTPAGVMTAWMSSDEHRKNALSKDYQEVGFGMAEGELDGEQTVVVVALYGSPLGSPALTQSGVLAATDSESTLITRFGIGLRSLDPAVLASIVLLLLTTVVGLFAYALKRELPANLRKGWKKHHALYKAVFTACAILALITLYGDGQIL